MQRACSNCKRRGCSALSPSLGAGKNPFCHSPPRRAARDANRASTRPRSSRQRDGRRSSDNLVGGVWGRHVGAAVFVGEFIGHLRACPHYSERQSPPVAEPDELRTLRWELDQKISKAHGRINEILDLVSRLRGQVESNERELRQVRKTLDDLLLRVAFGGKAPERPGRPKSGRAASAHPKSYRAKSRGRKGRKPPTPNS